jgi:hypothetical protein
MEYNNVYEDVKKWMLDGRADSEIPGSVYTDNFSVFNVLFMFATHGWITIELNNLFNNYVGSKIEIKHILKHVKTEYVQRYNINYYSSVQMSNINPLSKYAKKYPGLNTYELSYLINNESTDPLIKDLLDLIGYKDYTRTEKTKTKKKKTADKPAESFFDDEDRSSSGTPTPTVEDDSNITFQYWSSMFK